MTYQAGLWSDSGRGELASLIKNASLSLLGLSILVSVFVNMCSALKWYMLTRARTLGAGYWRIFSYYLIGQFYNLFLPTSVGGDVVRSYQLGLFSGRQADSLASVFVERYTGVLVLLLISGVAVLSQLAVFNVPLILFSLLAFTLGLGAIAWMLIDQRVYQVVRQYITAKLPVSDAAFNKIDKLLISITLYRGEKSAIFWAFVNSLLFYFAAVTNVYVTSLVFQFDVSFLDMLIATPIIMLIMNIPISIGNYGLMEAGYVGVFGLMGYSPTLGLSVAFLMRLKSFLDGAIGGLLQPLFIVRKQ